MRLTKLRELARLYSIQITYDDAAGKKRYASRDSLVAAMKLRLPEGIDLEHALQERVHARRRRVIEPVTVVWGRSAPAAEIHLPQSIADGTLEWTIELEKGDTRSGTVDLSAFPPLRSEDNFVAKKVTFGEALPHGYHTLHLQTPEPAQSFIIAAPGKAHAPRKGQWGVFAPLYAAHTRRSWGAGDLGDLERWREWVTSIGGSVVATLPMLAAFDDEPSPYSPVSRLFWNELYLDLTRMPEYDESERDATTVAKLRAEKQVDYDGVLREKRRVLELMAQRFLPDADYERFAESARPYAEFRARIEQKDSAAYHLYVQYRMAQQMREVADAARQSGGGLYLDFPLGVNPGGYDAERYSDSFAKGISVGAPPDLFFTKGQNWGFPPLDPDAIRENRYEYFRAALRHHVSHAGTLRLDHVMGLHRLFWIPQDGEAKDGVYVHYNAEELYAIVTLESTRHQCAVVGEDLGTVPPYVPKMMSKHGLRQMYVVQYEAKPESPALTEPPRQSVASINTHDMPTFAGFWGGRDIDDRLEQALLDERGATAERDTREAMRKAITDDLKARGLLHGGTGDTLAIVEAVLAQLSSSAAEIVLVNIEDLWLEEEPQNVPGVPGRSWRQKFRHGLEQIRDDQTVARILRTVNEQRRKIDGKQT